MDSKKEFLSYSEKRNINPKLYENYSLPAFLKPILPSDKSVKILDIGCGYGQNLRALKNEGYNDIKGIDLDQESIDFCISKKLHVIKNTLEDFIVSTSEKFKVVILSHVLEHIEKKSIIHTLKKIREHLIDKDGEIWIMVPNAQSHTGCYWAYEDFTHTTLFTSGSLYYVLKSAGFNTIEFLDPQGISEVHGFKKFLKKFFLNLYTLNYKFWNRITTSNVHVSSPLIFSFELRVRAK